MVFFVSFRAICLFCCVSVVASSFSQAKSESGRYVGKSGIKNRFVVCVVVSDRYVDTIIESLDGFELVAPPLPKGRD